jgi:hypothetical protein
MRAHNGAVAFHTFLIFKGELGSPLSWAVTATDSDDALTLIDPYYSGDPSDLTIVEMSPEEIQSHIPRGDFGMPLVRGIWSPHFDDP